MRKVIKLDKTMKFDNELIPERVSMGNLTF